MSVSIFHGCIPVLAISKSIEFNVNIEITLLMTLYHGRSNKPAPPNPTTRPPVRKILMSFLIVSPPSELSTTSTPSPEPGYTRRISSMYDWST
jgi:hypothetical protein